MMDRHPTKPSSAGPERRTRTPPARAANRRIPWTNRYAYARRQAHAHACQRVSVTWWGHTHSSREPTNSSAARSREEGCPHVAPTQPA